MSIENKGADQLRSYCEADCYCEADLRLCFRIYAKSRFSHDAAQMTPPVVFILYLMDG